NHFADTTHFAINILHEDQKDLSSCFARSGFDRFAGVEWTPGLNGAPVLPDVLATMECRVTQLVDAGDHVVIIGEGSHATWREGQPLLYFNSSYQTLRGEAEATASQLSANGPSRFARRTAARRWPEHRKRNSGGGPQMAKRTGPRARCRR